MRRLVITGKDTPENIAIFFGRGKPNITEEVHNSCRLGVLLRPPLGSSMYVFNRVHGLDRGCPEPWTPREPSADEARQLHEIRDMQETIRNHVGHRGTHDIRDSDMQEILVRKFGDRWPDGVQIYWTALNALDQGVHDDGYRLIRTGIFLGGGNMDIS